MNNHEEGLFLDVILENPQDGFPRLVFADWLEEQSDPRAELIRMMEEVRPMLAGYHPPGQIWLPRKIVAFDRMCELAVHLFGVLGCLQPEHGYYQDRALVSSIALQLKYAARQREHWAIDENRQRFDTIYPRRRARDPLRPTEVKTILYLYLEILLGFIKPTEQPTEFPLLPLEG